MPDFNYGDFTQQGIENKVTLKARLNERRYVTLDLQSDVEGPNLTISGNVHDELNNIDYPIGSAPNGNIEITENGENINVAPYATATVNVSGGGGDDNIILPMTEVTWDGTGVGGQLLIDPDTSDLTANEQLIIRLNVLDEEQDPWEIVLLGTYNPNAGPTSERISGITEGEPQVEIVLLHITDRPNEPWYLNISSADQTMPGTYIVGICTDIPHEVA